MSMKLVSLIFFVLFLYILFFHYTTRGWLCARVCVCMCETEKKAIFKTRGGERRRASVKEWVTVTRWQCVCSLKPIYKYASETIYRLYRALDNSPQKSPHHPHPGSRPLHGIIDWLIDLGTRWVWKTWHLTWILSRWELIELVKADIVIAHGRRWSGCCVTINGIYVDLEECQVYKTFVTEFVS